MGVYTSIARRLMLDALKGTNPTTPITHVGALKAEAGKAVTGVTSTDVFTSTAHGYANGDLVVLTALTGGTGLKAGNAGNADEAAWPYFVIGQTANTFQLAHEPGGAAVDLGTDVTAGTVQRLVEHSGGSPAYARKAIAYSAAVAPGTMDDSTNGAVIDEPAGAQADYIGYYSALTAGSLLAIDKITQETFGSQGTLTVTDSDLDLIAA